MFNLLAIIGISSLIGPIPVDRDNPELRPSGSCWPHRWCWPRFVFLRWSLGRGVGVVFLALYLGYIAVLLA